MLQIILDFITGCGSGGVMMAIAPLLALPAVASLASTVYGGIQARKARGEMKKTRQKWNAENESMYNQDYYSDFTQRADSQNLIKGMRDEQRDQNKIDQNTAVVTGATPEVQNAAKERRNKAMTSVFGTIGAQGQAWKDRAKDRYVSRKMNLQNMEYDDQNQNAVSANQMIANGITGMGQTDWAGIMGGGGTPRVENRWSDLDKLATPKVGL